MSDKDNEIPISLSVDTSALNDLEDAASSVPSEIELDVVVNDADLSVIDDIPESTETEVDVVETEDAKQAVADIHFMALKEKIETVWNIIGTGVGIITSLGETFVSPFLDVEDAVARINAQTGGTAIADLGGLIRDLQAADLGDSVEQISDVVIAAEQLGAPIEEASRAALTFTHTFDENPTTVLTTLNTLVETGLVPNLQAAADLMTVAFQEGVNKGGDALAIVNANAQSWSDMGLNGTEALSAINSLQDAGVESATDAAKMIQTLDDALTAAADNASGPQAEALKTLGMENPKDSGEAMGAEFIDGFAASFSGLPADKQDLISGVLFGKGGKKFTGALEGLTTQGGPFEDVVNAASDAATEIDNSLRGAIDDFVLEVNTTITELLSSKEIDLPGKIAALKEGFQEAVEVLASGGTLGEALEIGLNIPGFANSVERFEASIGNFVISVLEIIAGIQDFLGKDSSGTRRQITLAERQQLPFDLKVANADEIAGEVTQAFERGLSATDIAKAATTSISELINSGDLDKAQTLLDNIQNTEAVITPNLPDAEKMAAEFVLDSGDQNLINAAISKGILLKPELDVEAIQAQIDEAKKLFEQSQLDFGPKPAPTDLLGFRMAEQGGAKNPFLSAFDGLKDADKPGGILGGFITAADNLKTKTDETATNVSTSVDTMATDIGTSLDTVNTAFDTTAAEAALLDQGIVLSLTGNTVTTAFAEVAEAANESFPIVLQWFGKMTQGAGEMDAKISGNLQHLINSLHDLQFLSAEVAAGVEAALQAGANLPGAGGADEGKGAQTTNNINQINNNMNGAQSIASTYDIARAVSPGGG